MKVIENKKKTKIASGNKQRGVDSWLWEESEIERQVLRSKA